MAWSGKITNVEYLYDQSLRRYRIFYREDLLGGEVRYGSVSEKKINDFFPCVFRQTALKSDEYEMRKLGESLVKGNSEFNGFSWGGQKLKTILDDGYGTTELAVEANNSIWVNFPYLRSLRRFPVSYPCDPINLAMDYKYYEPVVDQSRQNFLSFCEREKENGALVNKILPNYQWIAQFVHGEEQNKDVKLRYFYLDIEVKIDNGIDVNAALNPITLIQINDSFTDETYLFYDKRKDAQIKERQENVNYIPCASEKEMLVKFVELCKEKQPACITGWFASGFDFRYIANRALTLARNTDANSADPIDEYFKVKRYSEHMFIKNNKKEYCSLIEELSPYKKVYENAVNVYGNIERSCYPYGVYFMDYLDVYKQYSYGQRSSYSLEAVCSDDLGLGKVQYGSIAENLDDIYDNEFDLFCKYGVQDVVLLNMLEKKLRFMNIAFMQAASMGINVSDVLGTIYPWMHKIYNRCLKLGFALPEQIDGTKANRSDDFEGGFTYCAPGKKRDLCAYDVTSLYPKTMESYNISYETLIVDERDKEGNRVGYAFRDEYRYLIVKYVMFDRYKETIEKITKRTVAQKEFTRELYDEYFSLDEILRIYAKFNVDPQDKLKDVVNKFINDDLSVYDELTPRLQVAGVSFSHVRKFFDNGCNFDKKELEKVKEILKRAEAINRSNSNDEEKEILKVSYFLEEIVDKKTRSLEEIEKIKKEAVDRVSVKLSDMNVLLTQDEKEGLISGDNTDWSGSENEKRLKVLAETSIKATVLSASETCVERDAKGIIPSLIAQTFAERKAAKNELEKYENIAKMILTEQIRRKKEKTA